MSISTANVRLFVSKVEIDQNGKSATVTASTSRKDRQNEGKYLYSNWYVKLLKDAMVDIEALMSKYKAGEKNEKGFLTKKFPIYADLAFTNEPYVSKAGETVWKNLQVACFRWSFDEPGEKGSDDESWLKD